MTSLEEREERERKRIELRREIQFGIDDLEAGRVVAMTPREMLEEIRSRTAIADSYSC